MLMLETENVPLPVAAGRRQTYIKAESMCPKAGTCVKTQKLM